MKPTRTRTGQKRSKRGVNSQKGSVEAKPADERRPPAAGEPGTGFPIPADLLRDETDEPGYTPSLLEFLCFRAFNPKGEEREE